MRIILIISLLLTGCTSIKDVHKISFSYYKGSQKETIVMKIPKGSTLVKITAAGEGEEHRYWYRDSSVIYLSTLSGSGTLNESFINSQPVNYNKRFSSDTASFSGIDGKGNYWKEVKRGNLLYGYSNVPFNKQTIFDKAINSTR